MSATVSSVTSLWSSLGPQVSEWLSGGVAKTTSRQYTSKVADWNSFASTYSLCERELFTRDTYEVSLRALTCFVYDLKTRLLRSSSHIKRTLQALRHDLLKKLYTVTVFSDPSLSLARRACKESARQLHKVRQSHRRLAVTFDVIDWLETSLLSTNCIDDEMTYVGTLLAFNFMLRCSEYCHSEDAPHALLCDDVTFVPLTGPTLTPLDLSQSASTPLIQDVILDLCSTKGDRDGKGRFLYLSRARSAADGRIIDALIRLCKRAKYRSLADPLLSRYKANRRKKLHRGMVSAALKRAANHFGFDSCYYSTHSLRIGGATCAAAGGRSRSTICRTGGWSETSSSDSLYRHITPHDTGILSVADEGNYVLTTESLRSMVPSFRFRPRT